VQVRGASRGGEAGPDERPGWLGRVEAAAYLALVARAPGLQPLRRELRPRTAVIGIAIIGGYDLVLYGLRLAAAAPVAAVRESSVVIGTALAASVLRERVGPARFCGSCRVAAVLAFAAGS
jgi:drug/metabolite transporter (DMT)-like permease